MKKLTVVLLSVILLFALVLSFGLVIYKNNIAPVSKTSVEVEFEVKENSAYSTLGAELKEKDLIKSELFYKVFIKLNRPSKLQKGIYILNKNMSLSEIVDEFEKGSTYDPNIITITFKEGLNYRKVAKLLSEKTNNKYEDFIKLSNDKTYIKSLITKYWFLTDDILNSNVYYPLEGYLFPKTYQISKLNTPQEIFTILLDQTEKELKDYKNLIDSNSLSVNQIMTLSSIIELEAGNADDRKGVAGVFYNRINSKWALGSDVTTYYANKIDDWSYSLTSKELNNCNNKYNTRCSTLKGLPIGPICNPGIESVKAALEPTKHTYYYFVADCKGKTYLTKNATEHANIINKLKKENNWCA